ncbi:MAG TPA: D-alanyl-D-alanine carboxypeptidase/D-alanyl-D-alanine-endopeptidase [Pyrinomonadaceae bacterium]|nr:D-alanyl-D-alanine carboxypeptidase/D-alanyl-D-alanine-endopeptidase [Pyrinomonadaceae bacterium]
MTRNRKLLLSLIALTVVVAAVALALGQRKVATQSKEKIAAASPAQKAAAPSPNAVDSSLTKEIDQIIDGSELKQGRLGVYVMSLSDGRMIYSRDNDRLFTPASNMKAYTTAVAIDSLGPDYRWRTSVYVEKQPDTNGNVNGDLVLYGRGAPDLISKTRGDAPSLAKFAEQLYAAGVRRVTGNIIGDESYFRGEMFGVGWQWNDLQWYYGAEPSALSVDENSIEVTMGPGAKVGDNASVAVSPNQNYVRLVNTGTTSDRDAPTSIGVLRDLSGNDLHVWGKFPTGGHAFSAFLSVHNPALWATTLFKQALIARGIKVDGEPRSRDFRVADKERFDPQKAIELASQESEPLSEIIRHTNKESDNLYAELILRTLGKERGSTAPDPDSKKNETRGDDEAGTAVVRAWLESKGISTRGLAIHDGSGLSRLDLITPESTARLFAAMSQSTAATLYFDSLPVAGHDGTLAGRLKKVEGRISAKTGSLTYVHSLSGYATTRTGERLAFSILCNDMTADRPAIALIDEIAASIAEFGPLSNPR